ncbi:MAG: hypothetical protein Q8O40_09500 [Chloroflexota bacterium]|nr:hypothetical protein [Chloroflexota bacterium]
MPNSNMLPGLGKVPTPLEVVDSLLDNVGDLVKLPARVGTKTLTAGAEAFSGVKSALDRPTEYADVPAPPDVVVQGAVDGLASIGGGVVKGITGIFDGLKETGDAVKGNLDALIKR